MECQNLINKAVAGEFLSVEEGVFLYENASTAQLMAGGNALRKRLHPNNIVTWIIDRNVNTTNVCVANCKFCNFFRVKGHPEAYITDIETYKRKIEETIQYGGDQLLLQGGHHPDLGIEYYSDLFKELKSLYPNIKLHALGPPEIAHIAKISGKTHIEVLTALHEAGLDSLPGAGAEILVDRVRNRIATGKCGSDEWLEVMRQAHKVGLTTSATMMFGHIETIEERFIHLERVRAVQDDRPAGSTGFIAFIGWPYQDEGTLLQRLRNINNEVTGDEYLRMLSLFRLMLPNIRNIQASWLTVGTSIGQMCLHAGANDFGSIMIEENVVSAAGAPHRFTASGIQKAILEAGFQPKLRDQQYQYRQMPAELVDQVIEY